MKDTNSSESANSSGVDEARIESAVREILAAVGEDPNRNGLLETPARVARSYREILGGYSEDPGVHLRRQFDVDHEEMIMVRDIPFSSLCEHHMLPFMGHAHVAYIPGPQGKVCGLSKLARVVDGYAKRLQVQERLTGQVADAMVKELDPAGVLVVIEAEHLCMAMRGVQKSGSMTTTSGVRGLLKNNATTRAEALRLLRGT